MTTTATRYVEVSAPPVLNGVVLLLSSPPLQCLPPPPPLDHAVTLLFPGTGASGGDVAQAEHLAALLSLAYPHSASLEPPLRTALLKRRDDVLDTLATLCRRAAVERSDATPATAALGPPSVGYGLPSILRTRATDPPLTLPPASPLAHRTLNTPPPALQTPLPRAGAGAVVVKTPGFAGAGSAAAAAPQLPWRLVLQAMDLLCITLGSASGDHGGPGVRLWPPGQSSAAAQLQSPQYAYAHSHVLCKHAVPHLRPHASLASV